MESLEESEFLNDTIMDFYINFLLDDMPASSPPLRRVSGGSKDTSGISRDDIFIFSTFFYKKLVDSAKNKIEDIEVSIMHVDSMHGVHHTANITKNLRPY